MKIIKAVIKGLLLGVALAAIAVHRPDIMILDALRSKSSPVVGNKYLKKHWQKIVKITFIDNPGSGGTGFLVKAKSGEAVTVTNAHVCEVADHGRVAARWDNGKYTFLSVLEVDKTRDLCVLTKLPGDLEPLELAQDEAQLYDPVFVIGHPLLDPNTFAEGLVRSRDLVFIAESTAPTEAACNKEGLIGKRVQSWFGVVYVCGKEFDAMSMSAHIYPGNSGSPVFNYYGKVVGVVFAGDQRTNYGFYVPLEHLESILAKY